MPVDLGRGENQFVPVQDQRRGFPNALTPFDRQFGFHNRVFGRQPKGEGRPRDNVVAGTIVLETEDLAGV